MTSINTNLSSYYQLTSALTGQQSNSSSGNSPSTGNTGGTSITQSLISALNAVDGAGTQNNSESAYSLNLSPAAQQLMGDSSAGSSSSSFTLTTTQQKTVEGILEQFAGQPFTQDTYDKIQQALQKAGLGANQLMGQDEANSLASPQTLINDLNGDIAPLVSPATTVSNEQSKAAGYMQNIVKEWQSLSNASTTATSQG